MTLLSSRAREVLLVVHMHVAFLLCTLPLPLPLPLPLTLSQARSTRAGAMFASVQRVRRCVRIKVTNRRTALQTVSERLHDVRQRVAGNS